MDLKGKTAIVTGGTSGIGKAIALEFARNGCRLVISGRNSAAGKEVVDLIRETGSEAVFFKGDISAAETNQELVRQAITNFGSLHIVCCNAGQLGLGKVDELPIQIWRETLDTNLSAAFYLMKYALPELKKTKSAAVIFNSSIAAFKSFPNHPAYCASKAGLIALGKQIAVEYAPAIRLNIICPGPVDTPLIHDSAKAFPDPASAVENAGRSVLLKRLGLPEDVARLALFLASDASSWMTGAVIPIDGGALAAV